MEKNPFLPFSPKSNTVLAKYGNQSVQDHIIDLPLAVNYYNNFYKTRLSVDSDITKKAWFSIDSLDHYFEKVYHTCQLKDIKITGMSFLFGAKQDNTRTVFIAPMCYDPKMEMDRAFTISDNEIVFLHGHLMKNHSTITNCKTLIETEESLVLGENGFLSISQVVALYNNYYDAKIKAFPNIVKTDTRIVYYRKGEFEGYIDYLKEQCEKEDIELTGINAVFSVYNNDASYGDYANLMTLFFAPTTSGKKSFFSFDLAHENFLDFSRNTWGDIQGINQISSSMFNRGSSSPPPWSFD
ncbi:MAG: hypothetical protein R2819_03250 [Allomuricauda sp.]